MKRPQIHITMEPGKLEGLAEQAETLGVTVPELAGVILATVADVRPRKLWLALGSIPESYLRPSARIQKTS
ncbi:MAG TPA: hypothetical protein VK163_01305 [Opitutaceae bacterium]|nr:hypothetical protein [Opitutaceae bacterium]